MEFFTGRTSVQFDMPAVFPDYHAEAPGGVQGGRSMVTRPFSGKELGPFIHKLAPPLPELTVLGMMLASGDDIRHFMRAFKSWTSFRYVCRRLIRHAADVLRHGRGMGLTNGNALAGRLAKSALDLNIPIWLSSPAVRLILDEGRVESAIVEHEGKSVQINARQGVVLACGGFPHVIERRNVLFPHVRNGDGHHSPSPAANTGDGLRLGEEPAPMQGPSIIATVGVVEQPALLSRTAALAHLGTQTIKVLRIGHDAWC